MIDFWEMGFDSSENKHSNRFKSNTNKQADGEVSKNKRSTEDISNKVESPDSQKRNNRLMIPSLVEWEQMI